MAEISHLSYVRQKTRDHGVPLGELTLEVTDHDRERAEDIVAELERLGVYREPVRDQKSDQRDSAETAPTEIEQPEIEPPETEQPEIEQPEADLPPPPTERPPKPVTDLWGNPIKRRRR